MDRLLLAAAAGAGCALYFRHELLNVRLLVIGREVRVALRGDDRLVAEQLLDAAKVHSLHHQARCECVTLMPTSA
jgi:hypothetical protein